MAIRNTFVTIADGDQLNEGYFNGIQPQIDVVNGSVTFAYNKTGFSTSSSTYQDALNVTSPAAKFDGQNVLIEAQLTMRISGAMSNPVARVYDVTNSTELETYSDAGQPIAQFNEATTGFYIGKVAIPTAGNTLNIKVQYRGDGSDTMSLDASMLKLTLLPN